MMKEMELTYVPKAETNNLVLAWDREQSNAHIYTDRDRLIQILEHLLDNAIKFTTKGTVRWGYQEKENGQIRFYVTDTGCGIPNDKKEVIFERFVKLDSFTQGLGLGCPFVKLLLSVCTERLEWNRKLEKDRLSGLLSPIYPTIIFKIYG